VGLLDAATYTVTYQSKTIWSGVFSVVLLGRVLKISKWVGLALLSVGVGVVQLSGVQKAKERQADDETVGLCLFSFHRPNSTRLLFLLFSPAT